MWKKDPDGQGGVTVPVLIHNRVKSMLCQVGVLGRSDFKENKEQAPVDLLRDSRVKVNLRTSTHPPGSFVEEVVHIFRKGETNIVLFPVMPEI